MKTKLALSVLLLVLLAGCGEDAPDQGNAEAVRTFLQGNAAFQRSVELEEESLRPRGDPEAAKAALQMAEDALAYWQWAAATRMDWPQARRNVERALIRLDRLREKRKDSSGRGDGKGDTPGDQPPPDSPPRPEPPAPPRPPEEEIKDPPDDPATRVATKELPPGRVLGLFDVLEQREREKAGLRRAQRRVRGAQVERDW